MGAFGSCLGRPLKSDNSHFFPSNLISINANLFGSASNYKYDRQTDDEESGLPENYQLNTTDYYATNDWRTSKSDFESKLVTEHKNRLEIGDSNADRWYFGLVSRKEAEARLRAPGSRDGSFMVRNSETGGPGQLTLSIKHGNVVKHYRIICDEQQKRFFINKRKPFGSITDLVIHYKKAVDGLCIKLSEPCQESIDCKAFKHQQRPLSYHPHDSKKADVKSGTKYQDQFRGTHQFADSAQGLTRYILAGTKNLFSSNKK